MSEQPNRAVITVPYELDAACPIFERNHPGPLLAIFKVYIEGFDRFKLRIEVHHNEIPAAWLAMIPEPFNKRCWMWHETGASPMGKDNRGSWKLEVAYSDPAERMDTDA